MQAFGRLTEAGRWRVATHSSALARVARGSAGAIKLGLILAVSIGAGWGAVGVAQELPAQVAQSSARQLDKLRPANLAPGYEIVSEKQVLRGSERIFSPLRTHDGGYAFIYVGPDRGEGFQVAIAGWR